jgi:ABC-2 type transport system permease protein
MSAAAPALPSERGIGALVRDTRVLAGRSVRRALLRPNLVGMVSGPLMFLFVFYIAFRSLVGDLGIDYEQFLPPAIVVQAMLLVAMSTAFFVTAERRSGLLERWRTLPIHRGAVPAARLVADTIRATICVVVIATAAHLIGFRFDGVLAAIAFVLLAVAFALCIAAGTAAIGLTASSPEVVISLLFLPYLPLIVLSTAYVPASSFPDWLQPVVRASPVTAVADSLRAIASGGSVFPALAYALAWIVGLGVVCGAAAARGFRRRA